nr:hypothetical protein [uncultured Methanolobus sp.]
MSRVRRGKVSEEVMVKSKAWSIFNTRKEERQTVTFENEVTEEEAKEELIDFFKLCGFPLAERIEHLTDWKAVETTQ